MYCVPNVTTVTNVLKMTKNDPGVHVFGSVHFYMKELIIIPLKFKMVNGRGPPY